MNALLFCLGMVVVLTIIFGLVAFIRYQNYRETITLAEQGIVRPETQKSKSLLYWGMAITVLGLVLTVLLYTPGILSVSSYPLHLGPWMLGGFILLFLGLGLVLLHYLNDRD